MNATTVIAIQEIKKGMLEVIKAAAGPVADEASQEAKVRAAEAYAAAIKATLEAEQCK